MPNRTLSKSPRKSQSSKPKKPRKDFPLFPHDAGQWAKKIKKRLVYFGSWRTDPKGTAAEALFDREWPYLKKGETPPAVDVGDGLTLRQLCNLFLAEKEAQLDDPVDRLSPRTFKDYYLTCDMLIRHFGPNRRIEEIPPDDFREFRLELAKGRGKKKCLNAVSLKNEINRVCIVFNRAYPIGEKQRSREHTPLIDKPVIFGPGFKPPSAKALRKNRNEAGEKLFERDELLRILDALEGKPVAVAGQEKPVTQKADPILRAMVLLGINCGFGNTDVASLPKAAIDWTRGWVTFPRPKTEVKRRIALWPETIAALKVAIAMRPAAADKKDAGLCFLTASRRDAGGRPWVRIKVREEKPTDSGDGTLEDVVKYVVIDAVSPEFKKVLKKLHTNGRRGLGFYSLRHCFETYGGECKDQIAVDACMGHVDASMAANYRHKISDDRLRAVTDTVRAWLFSPAENGGEA